LLNLLGKTASKRSVLKTLALISFFAVLTLDLLACGVVYVRSGLYYRLKPGETLTAVAKTYKISVQELAEINDIHNPKLLRPGSRIFIPRVKVAREVKRLPKGAKEVELKYDRTRFIWPVQGRLTSRFGARSGVKHHGIDVAAKNGAPILSAAAGKVGFSGKLRGYGNVVLVKHADNFHTVYAHNTKNLVQKGQSVKQGELIARVGSTGRSTGPHLHFEVHKGRQARNPLFFLPKRN
jgi:murein DD-endopeptidase MepM/ murein hydrolase activator NlpD